MQYNSPSLKIQGTTAFVSPHEIFFLAHPIESSLQDFIFENVLKFNFARNIRYRDRPSAQFLVGIDLAKITFASKQILCLPARITVLSENLTPESILESIYQEVELRRP